MNGTVITLSRGTLCALTLLWFGISVPLVFVGSYFGFKKAAPEQPVRTNKIPRQAGAHSLFTQHVFARLKAQPRLSRVAFLTCVTGLTGVLLVSLVGWF